MAYNKAAAEKEWLRWKETEESKMRELGVDEDIIQQLHFYDWAMFKAERNYRRWQMPMDEYMQKRQGEMEELPVKDTQSLLDSIEDERLLLVLQQEDKLTLEIVRMKMEGYSSPEIENITGLKQMAINKRLSRLRQKLKNIF